MRTVTKNEDDIWPVLTVWLPTAAGVYFITGWLAKIVFIKLGYTGTIEAEICGGGSCDTVYWVAAEYYASQIALIVFLVVVFSWFIRNMILTTDKQ